MRSEFAMRDAKILRCQLQFLLHALLPNHTLCEYIVRSRLPFLLSCPLRCVPMNISLSLFGCGNFSKMSTWDVCVRNRFYFTSTTLNSYPVAGPRVLIPVASVEVHVFKLCFCWFAQMENVWKQDAQWIVLIAERNDISFTFRCVQCKQRYGVQMSHVICWLSHTIITRCFCR